MTRFQDLLLFESASQTIPDPDVHPEKTELFGNKSLFGYEHKKNPFSFFYSNNVSTPEHQEKGIKYCFHKNQSRLERQVPTRTVLSMTNPDYNIKLRQAVLTNNTDYTAKMGKTF